MTEPTKSSRAGHWTLAPTPKFTGRDLLHRSLMCGSATLAMGTALAVAGPVRADGLVSLGVLPSGTYSIANGISADGTVVVGYGDTPDGSRAYRWTSAGGMQSLGIMDGGSMSFARAVSSDGSVVVGNGDTADGFRAFYWTSAGGMVNLGTLSGGATSVAMSTSADGTVVVGQSGSSDGGRGFRWTAADGMVSLGVLDGGADSYAYSVSADGTTVVGFSDISDNSHAFRWTSAGGMVDLGMLAGGWSATAFDVNADGSVVVGSSTSSDGARGFRWTAADGMVSLGVLDGGTGSNATAVNADGTVVVGTAFADIIQRAYRWTSEGGMVSLGTLAGGTFSNATGVSADGSVVVGNSGSTAGQRAFIWHGVMQDTANLLGSFSMLTAATDVSLAETGNRLSQTVSAGCEVAQNGKSCVSVSGNAAAARSVGKDGSVDSSGQGLSSVTLGLPVGNHAMAGAVVAMGSEAQGDILTQDDRLAVGGYLRWTQTGDYRTGLNLRTAFGKSSGDAEITRGIGLADVETKAASATIDAVTASAEATYGIETASHWLMSPSVGLNWQQAKRAAYGESNDLAFRAQYDAAEASALTLTLGLTAEYRISDAGTLQLRIAGERDINVNAASLSGTSNVPGLETFDLASNLDRKETRGLVEVAHVWAIGPAKTIRGGVKLATPTYGSDIDASVSLSMNVSF